LLTGVLTVTRNKEGSTAFCLAARAVGEEPNSPYH
jgi:hypothetical protein